MFSDLTLGTLYFKQTFLVDTKIIWQGVFFLNTFHLFSQIYSTLNITISGDMWHINFFLTYAK